MWSYAKLNVKTLNGKTSSGIAMIRLYAFLVIILQYKNKPGMARLLTKVMTAG